MKRKNAGTSLFLMEMIIIVLFFSVASAVCVQAFVNAHLLDRQTRELNHAVIIAQGFADVVRGTDGSIESILKAYPMAVESGELELTAYYDKDFEPCSAQDESAYIASIELKPEKKLQTVTVSVRILEDDSEIYTLTASKYTGTTE